MGTGSYEEAILNSFGQTYAVGSGVSTISTVCSTATDASGDIRDANVREIHHLALDTWKLQDQLSRLIETLRERRIIPS